MRKWRFGLRSKRGRTLLFFGLLDLIYSVSLINPDRESRAGSFLTAIAATAPLWFWAALWGLTGLLCFWYAFRRCDRVGFTAAVFLKVTWATACVGAWLIEGADRAYVSAAIWIAAAAFVWDIATWPEPDDEGRREPLWRRRSS